MLPLVWLNAAYETPRYNLSVMQEPAYSDRPYLYFTAFAAGMVTLAVELTASRLLGSVFGVSNLVWASIIGLILVYLTVGYLLGGRLADRYPNPKTMYVILAWGALTAGLTPLLARPVLTAAADAFDRLELGILFGSFAAVLVLFSIPITLLGTISPFAIRLAIRDPSEAGRVSGMIYGISTIGSFTGTFLPVLVLIPLVGTTRTFLVFSGFLLVVALVGLWRAAGLAGLLPWLWMPVLLAFVALMWSGGTIKKTTGQIYEAESAYNYIQVLKVDGFYLLRLNEGQGVHSIYHPDRLVNRGTWMQFLAAPFFNPAPYPPEQVSSMAIVGLAGGTSARQATTVFGPIPIDGFEIDPAVIEVGRKYFGMTEPNLQAIAQDGRWGLQHSGRSYALIALDAYRPPYIPWHLTTQEFFEIVRDHLTDDGVIAINVGRAPDDRRLIAGLVGTLETLFPSIYVMDVPATFNSIIYATRQPTQVENLSANFSMLVQRGDVHPLLLESIQNVLLNLQPMPEPLEIFTDERAPVESITNNMILRFMLSGGMEDLQ